MAQFQYDIVTTAPQTPGGVAQGFTQPVVKGAGAAIGTSEVRLTIDAANAGSKHEVLRALELLYDAVLQDTWPPT